MTTTPQPARKVSNNPKRANGRGSRYQIPQKSGKKVWKAAIHDATGKLRTKQFDKLAEAEDWLAEQRRARELGAVHRMSSIANAIENVAKARS